MSPADLYNKKCERNVKAVSLWSQKKMIPDGGLDLHKRLKSTSSGNYIDKLYKEFYLTIYISLKDNWIGEEKMAEE